MRANHLDSKIERLMHIAPDMKVELSIADLYAFADRILQGAMTQQADDDRLLSVQDVCKMLHKSRKTLYNWDKAGYLQPINIGCKPMYRQSDIDALIDRERRARGLT